MSVREVYFSLHLSADEYVKYYQGAAKDVLVKSYDGRRIRFPAKVLRPFVTRSGISGEFAIQYDANHKFVGIKRKN